jgi:hypothetical protein
MGRLIRVLQFADVINRDDFIDVIVRRADPGGSRSGGASAARTATSLPGAGRRSPRWVIDGTSTRDCRGRFMAGQAPPRWGDVLHNHHYDQAVIGWLATRFIGELVT